MSKTPNRRQRVQMKSLKPIFGEAFEGFIDSAPFWNRRSQQWGVFVTTQHETFCNSQTMYLDELVGVPKTK